MRIVSFFSGAGGLDLGLERSGLKAISLVELEKVFCDSLFSNKDWKHIDGRCYFEDSNIINANLNDIQPSDLKSEKKIDLII